jgi:hypothetical protein
MDLGINLNRFHFVSDFEFIDSIFNQMILMNTYFGFDYLVVIIGSIVKIVIFYCFNFFVIMLNSKLFFNFENLNQMMYQIQYFFFLV